jgi:hypothetical protein
MIFTKSPMRAMALRPSRGGFQMNGIVKEDFIRSYLNQQRRQPCQIRENRRGQRMFVVRVIQIQLSQPPQSVAGERIQGSFGDEAFRRDRQIRPG